NHTLQIIRHKLTTLDSLGFLGRFFRRLALASSVRYHYLETDKKALAFRSHVSNGFGARRASATVSLLASPSPVGCRATGEQLAPVRQFHLFGVAYRLSGLGAIALDDNWRSRRDRIFAPAHPQEGIRRAH